MSQDLHPAPALDIPESTEESGVRAWLRQKIWSSERRELALAWQSEADHVTRLILLRLRYPGDQPDQWGDVHLGSELERIPPWQREFVYHRYASRIRWYAQAYPRLLRWHTGLALLVVAAGLASSGLAAVNEGREDTSLGLSLAVIILEFWLASPPAWLRLGSLNRSQRAITRARMTCAMRDGTSFRSAVRTKTCRIQTTPSPSSPTP
jgi:hypothetical protein